MDEKKIIKSIATAGISIWDVNCCYVRAAEFAAELNNDEWANGKRLSKKLKDWTINQF